MRQMRLEKREIKDPAELEKVLDACKSGAYRNNGCGGDVYCSCKFRI